ncbi:H-2 class II histocompatibility antigen, E-D beta chain [Cricetulus griseus]|uniref:H-2 class II histocompatibility antigen, E-D beta chain n=1 Tax=Cricetulus griseus TaxID=10029 RepID=A0A9J7HB55_CRIGR|nr:H-2 class II histocompatibility antigen, E-D beta chain [Cricetulus griseus]XP_035307319.1 H-2 class II histocompatibility antigen, E-D beta chain [Cricetulus griseus]
MMGLWLPRGSCVAAVVLLLMALSPPVALVRDPRPRFLEQLKAECYFLNGTERVRIVTRFIYNQEEFAQFDSDIGKFLAVTELGQPIAEDLNSQKDVLENYRASVNRCRNSYRLVDWFLLNLKAEPQVSVYPTKMQPQELHNILVCSVSGFYPRHIEVRWFRNGQEEKKTGVMSTGLIPNGDWTYQILVMLKTVPQSGEVYTCQVEHPSLTSPVTVEWTAQSTSTQNRVWSGVIFVLGLILLGAGFDLETTSSP